jgi:hypothetical protein
MVYLKVLMIVQVVKEFPDCYGEKSTSTNIMFLDIIHRPVFISNTDLFIFQNPGDWIISPSSGKAYSVGSNR